MIPADIQLSHTEPRSWRIEAHVRWAVQAEGLLLIDTGRKKTTLLGYPEAGVWDLINRYHAPETIIRLLAHIADLSPQEAGRFFNECVSRWASDGLLSRVKR